MKPAEALYVGVVGGLGAVVAAIGWPFFVPLNAWRKERFRRVLALPRADVDPAAVTRARLLVQETHGIASGFEYASVLELWTAEVHVALPDTDPAHAPTLAALQARGLARTWHHGGTLEGVAAMPMWILSALLWGSAFALVLRCGSAASR